MEIEMKSRWHIGIGFEPRDIWIGAYWDKKPIGIMYGGKAGWKFDLWVCVVPMVPIHLTIVRNLAYLFD